MSHRSGDLTFDISDRPATETQTAVKKPVIAARKPRHNQSGQAMGAKGQQTRQRLLEATADLIQSKKLRELTVSDITRRAKTAASTFYLYFQDASEAVLAVARTVSQSTPELLDLVEGPWAPEEAYGKAQTFALSYAEHWARNRAIFRVRNLAADEGDERFSTVRRLSVAPLLGAIAQRIERNQNAGRVPPDLHPYSAAGALMALMERTSSVTYEAGNENDVTHARVTHAVAFFAVNLLAGMGATAPDPDPAAEPRKQ